MRPQITPFDLFFHFFVGSPVIHMLAKFEVSSFNHSRDMDVPRSWRLGCFTKFCRVWTTILTRILDLHPPLLRELTGNFRFPITETPDSHKRHFIIRAWLEQTLGFNSLLLVAVVLWRLADGVDGRVWTGHNWGSQHDPDSSECSPSSNSGGKFLMYPYAQSGIEPNNKVWMSSIFLCEGCRVVVGAHADGNWYQFLCRLCKLKKNGLEILQSWVNDQVEL